MNGTLQGRLVNELKLSGREVSRVSECLHPGAVSGGSQQGLLDRASRPESSFVAAGGVDLDEIFCREVVRTPARTTS